MKLKLDSADIKNLKFIAKSSEDVTTSALLNVILLEVNFKCDWCKHHLLIFNSNYHECKSKSE